jgi:membrane protein implicated in regulation of membrane protease activity
MMDANAVVMYAWIVWVALILVFIIIEVFTLDLTFLMLAIGSVGGVTSSLLGAPVWAQIVITAVLAVLLIFGVRPPLLRALRSGSDPALSNVEALLGTTGTVATSFVDSTGYVKLANGETWTSRLLPTASTHTLEPGDRVVVVAIEGATAVVEPVGGPVL